METEAGGQRIGLNHAEVGFSDTLKELSRHWGETSSFWRDEARTAFQKAFVNDLLASGRAALKAMVEIQKLLGQIIRECG